MKAFLKTYWLEFLLFAVGLVGAAIAMPFLPGSVPRQWSGGQVAATMPKAGLFLIPAVQLAVCFLFHWQLKRCLDKLPALAPTLSGVEYLLPGILSVVCLSLELCVMLAAWGGGGEHRRGAAGGAGPGACGVFGLFGKEIPGKNPLSAPKKQKEAVLPRVG